MKKFGADVIDDLILELEKSKIKKIVGVYGGRFQPFGPHHKKVYEWLKSKFDDAYITTSNIKQLPRHPMNFSEKVRHMTKMGIPKSKIVMERTPFVAKKLLGKFDPETTAVVYIFGKKDTGRLSGGKYFQDFLKNKNNLKGHEEHGYYLVAPHMSVSAGGLEVSGTSMRNLLGSPKYKDQREKLFKKMFGYYDKGLFNMMTNKFSKLFEVNEAYAVRGSKVEKFITGHNLTHKGRKYKQIDFETVKIDNTKGLVTLKILAPKKLFGQITPVTFKTLRRGPFLKTDTSKKISEAVTLPINVGDTVLMGKFKNKKVKVKSIGVNEKGDVLINGRPATKFRLFQKDGSEDVGVKHYANKIKVTNEQIEHFLIKYDIGEIIKEATTNHGTGAPPDSGPGAYFKEFGAYKIDSINMAAKLGFEVMRYGLSGALDDEDDYPIYDADWKRGDAVDGPVPAVSWFPAGLGGKATANNQIDLWGSKAWNAWIKHMNPIAATVGMKLVDELEYGDFDWAKDEIKKQSMDGSKETKKVMDKEEPPDTPPKVKLQKPKDIQESIDISHLMNELVDRTFNRYQKIRKYQDSELQNELGEYFENKDAHRIMPDLAQDENELREMIKSAKLYYLSNDTIYNMENTDAANILDGMEAQDIYKMLGGYEKDWESVRNAFRNQKYLPAPIVVRDSNKVMWLLGGNTRLCIGLSEGMLLPVKIIEYNRPFILNGMHESLKENLVTKNQLQPRKKELLLMGGAYGHMAHPFDDKDLTFGDLKTIITMGLGGTLNREDGVTEKLDGQNIMVSWKDGKLIAARNKGHIKNGGKTALDAKGIRLKFAGRGDIANAFNFAMTDLSKAIGSLSQKQKDKIFNNGYNFMNLEVMWPKSANVIDYDVATLVFHGALIYDDNATVKGQVPGSGRILAGMIKQVNQHIQSKYSIGKPNFLNVPKHQDFGKLKDKFLSSLARYQSKFGLGDGDTLGLYHQRWWEQFITKQSKGKITGNTLKGLVKRWAFFDKSYSIPMIKKDLDGYPEFLDWVLSYDKNDHAKQVKENMKPFEIIFFEVGAEIMKNISGFIAANPDKAVQGIKKRLDAAISSVRSGGDLKKLNTLKVQLDRLNAIGGMKAIVPSEGIVFKYKGKTYKFTGAFAPINQITGLMAF